MPCGHRCKDKAQCAHACCKEGLGDHPVAGHDGSTRHGDDVADATTLPSPQLKPAAHVAGHRPKSQSRNHRESLEPSQAPTHTTAGNGAEHYTIHDLRQALTSLKVSFELSNATTLAQIVRSNSWDSLGAASELVQECTDLYSQHNGNLAAQHWILAFLASLSPRIVPLLSLNDLALLTIFIVMMNEAPAAPAHLPTVIDLSAAVFRDALAVCAARSDDPDLETVLVGLEQLRACLRSHVAPTSAPASAMPAVHAAGALLEVILAVTPVSVLGLRVDGQSGEVPAVLHPTPCRLPSTLSATHPLSADAPNITSETLTDLLQALTNPHSSMRVCVSVGNSIDHLLRQRGLAVAKIIIPEFCRLAQPIGRRAVGAIAPGCLTASFVETYLSICSTITRSSTLAAYHKVALTAASAVGGAPILPLAAFAPGAAATLPADFIRAARGAGDAGADDVVDAAAPAAAAEEVTLETTAGRRPLSDIVATVVASLKRLDLDKARHFADVHRQGYTQMHLNAALKLQQAEYDRLRRHLASGIDGVPVGRILSRLPGREEAAVQKASGTIQQPRLRGSFARAAFHASLDVFERMIESTTRHEGRIARAQAAVARALAMVPEEAVDDCFDRLCEVLLDIKASADAGTAANATKAASLTELCLQTLFIFALELAPAGTGGYQFHTESTTSSVFGDSATHNGDAGRFTAINVSAPIKWMTAAGQDDDDTAAGKRRRNGDALVNEDDDDAFAFYDEASDRPTTAYSHLLCRILSVLLESGDLPAILELLINCPVVTIPAWLLIHRRLCMSDTLANVERGMNLLTDLLVRRPKEEAKAVSLLLFYATATRQATRLYACRQVLGLAQSDAAYVPIVHEFVKETIAALATATIPRVTTAAAGLTIAQTQAVRIERIVVKYVSLFAAMCSLEPALLSHLFDAFAKADPTIKQAVLSASIVKTLFVDLARSKSASTGVPLWISCLKVVRQHPAGADALAIRALQTFSDELIRAAKSAEGGGSNAQQQKADLAKYAKILTTQCAQLYERQGNDIRFMFPVFPFTARAELRDKYVPQLLRLCDKPEENAADVDSGLMSMFRNAGLAADCGISPRDLFVLLHQLPERRVVPARNASVAIQRMLTKLRQKTREGVEVPLMDPTELTLGSAGARQPAGRPLAHDAQRAHRGVHRAPRCQDAAHRAARRREGANQARRVAQRQRPVARRDHLPGEVLARDDGHAADAAGQDAGGDGQIEPEAA
jgi:hypothetical protein